MTDIQRIFRFYLELETFLDMDEFSEGDAEKLCKEAEDINSDLRRVLAVETLRNWFIAFNDAHPSADDNRKYMREFESETAKALVGDLGGRILNKPKAQKFTQRWLDQHACDGIVIMCVLLKPIGTLVISQQGASFQKSLEVQTVYGQPNMLFCTSSVSQ